MATLKDIAVQSGVSVSAVSRILNHDATLGVPPETRQRVFDTAKKLGYHKVRRKTNKKKTDRHAFTMGIIQWFSAQEELQDHYYLQIRQGIEDFCVRHSIEIRRAFQTDTDHLRDLEKVDGLVCIGKFSDKEAAALSRLCSNVIFIDMHGNAPDLSAITLDFEGAVRTALHYLESLGHEQIAYLGGKEFTADGRQVTDERREAYIRERKEKGLFREEYLLEGIYSSASGYELMKELLSHTRGLEKPGDPEENGREEKDENAVLPTAVFCASDNIAFGALKAVHDYGLKVPEDISLIGFDDVEMCAYSSPPLTTLRAPAYAMGQQGANLVFTASNLSSKTPMKIRMSCRLVKRESAGVRKRH